VDALLNAGDDLIGEWGWTIRVQGQLGHGSVPVKDPVQATQLS
jgi:hypothetical protein